MSVRNRKRYAHSARTGKGLRKRIKKLCTGSPLKGSPPRKISRQRTSYTFLFIRTHADTSPVYTVCIVVLPEASRDRISLADETYSSSAFVSLQILIAFAPNPTYTFSAASATWGSVSISIKTSAKNKTRIFSEYPGPRNKDARDVSIDLTLQYLARTTDGPGILVYTKFLR